MSILKRFLRDESGAEVAEVGIWLGLVVAISVGLIATLGTNVQTAFTTINGLFPS
jgi:Flp pilus assembly pilin Flp